MSAPKMRQIETVQAAAAANGWTVQQLNDWPDQSRHFAKDDRGITVWFGHKGNLSSADPCRYSGERGLRFDPTLRSPQLLAKVLAELAR